MEDRSRERDDETDITDCQTGRQTGIETGAGERTNKHPGVGVHGHDERECGGDAHREIVLRIRSTWCTTRMRTEAGAAGAAG